MRLSVSLALTLGTMTAANIAAHRVIPAADAAVSVALVGGLTAIARASDLSADELGLARRSWASGLRWGGAAAGVAAAGYAVAALLPAAREVTADPTGSWSAALLKALVVIPLVTVIPEEFAFRGVLWGLLRRGSGR